MPTASSVKKLAIPGKGKSGATSKRFFSVRTYSATFATEFSVMVAQIAVYKLAAHWMGQIGFSEYALVRRVLALLPPITMLGLSVGLPRYLALADGRGESARSGQYFLSALFCGGGFTACLAGALMLRPHWFSYIFFGGTEYQYLLHPLAFMLIGLSAHSLLYAFLRGKLAVGRANVLQLINNAVVPLLVFSVFHKNTATLLWYLGFAWTLVACIMFLFTPLKFSWRNPLPESRELLHYGLQRVPGDFAFMALLTLPAIFAAHLGTIHEAGMVAFGLSLVNMIASLFSPVGIILLPKVSRAIGGADLASVRDEIDIISRLAVLLSGAFVILFEVFGGWLIRIYLGRDYADAHSVINVLVVGALPLAIYSTLRSVIDAFHCKAVNTLNLLVALGLFLTGSAIGAMLREPRAFLWSFSCAVGVLAVLTWREVRKILGPTNSNAAVADVAADLPEGLA
jgi:O-antigen/teichoic acid export membrane protein